LEEAPDEKQRIKRIQKFWQSQRFIMPTLIDTHSEMFKAYASTGLPSVVLISADGTILNYHEGFLLEMETTLKSEIRAAVSKSK
jgi:hypothetical protein